ncbi:hypothetical protein [Prauserella marina]|uniref:hypothetical protein n=1 Tax=Prauserella marina TaxID=530584 RepID=UPI0015A4CA9C|nr:hypothetical protein [Prauserella marina]
MVVASIATEPANGWPAPLRTWRTLDLPDGWKAGITERAHHPVTRTTTSPTGSTDER